MEQKVALHIEVLPHCTANLDPGRVDISDKYKGIQKKFSKAERGLPKYIGSTADSSNSQLHPKATATGFGKFTISAKYAQATAKICHRIGAKPLIVMFANGFTPGGYGEGANAQEESILGDANISMIMPTDYPYGLIISYAGLYLVREGSLKIDEEEFPVDFAFIPMPNLGAAIPALKTPAEGQYFDRASYLRHITALVILQFHAAKLNGNIIITGRHGCGIFGNDDEDISAVTAAVANLPEFSEVKVIYALGEDGDARSGRKVHDIYQNPLENKLAEAAQCITSIRQEVSKNLEMTTVSEDLMFRYCLNAGIFPMDIFNTPCILDIAQKKLNTEKKPHISQISRFISSHDGKVRYQFQFPDVNSAEAFSQKIFDDFSIGAQSDPDNKKLPAPNTDVGILTFTDAQCNLLLNIQRFQHYKRTHGYSEGKISRNLIEEIKQFIQRKGVSSDRNDQTIGNAFKSLLKLSEKGYPYALVMSYLYADYPELSAVFPNSEAGCLLKKIESDHRLREYRLFGSAKATDANSLQDLLEELNSNKTAYAFSTDDEGREKLRKISRQAHGYDPNDTDGNIREIYAGSMLANVLAGQNQQITDANGKSIIVNAESIKSYQEGIEILHDEKITPEEILKIQYVKTGVFRESELSQAEHNALQFNGKHFMVRGESDQYLDEKGCVLDKPRHRIFYYACFPDLREGTADFKKFAGKKVSGSETVIGIIDNEGYKNEVKDVLRLMLRMANQHRESLDIVTPNAFFAGLSASEQRVAKRLFGEAILELISEENFQQVYGNVPAIILHADEEIEKLLNTKEGQIKVPVILSTGDASSPQYAAMKMELPFKVAEALMGDVLGPAGNGGLGPRANQAKEENDARKTFLQVVFNARFNPAIITKIYALKFSMGEAPVLKPYQPLKPGKENCILQ